MSRRPLGDKLFFKRKSSRQILIVVIVFFLLPNLLFAGGPAFLDIPSATEPLASSPDSISTSVPTSPETSPSIALPVKIAAVGPESKTPISTEETETPSSAVSKSENGLSAFFRTIAHLLFVLALVFVFFYFMKKFSPRQLRPLPKGVIEIFGHYPLTAKARLSILRFGSQLLLVSIAGDRVETLAVIDDPVEIDEIKTRCREESFTTVPSLMEQWIKKFKERKGTT